MVAKIAALEAALGHSFGRPELLVRALTHRSLAHELAVASGSAIGVGDNERLEFLGDSVLGMVVAEALFQLHPEWQEGELSRVRAQLVSRQHMAEVATAIGLSEHMRLSRGEENSGTRNSFCFYSSPHHCRSNISRSIRTGSMQRGSSSLTSSPAGGVLGKASATNPKLRQTQINEIYE